MKRIGLTASEEKSFENVHDGQQTDGRRSPNACIYYKLIYEPSLKALTHQKPPRRFCTLFLKLLSFTTRASSVVVNTVHWDEPIRLQDFSTNQIQGLRSRSQRF